MIQLFSGQTGEQTLGKPIDLSGVNACIRITKSKCNTTFLLKVSCEESQFGVVKGFLVSNCSHLMKTISKKWILSMKIPPVTRSVYTWSSLKINFKMGYNRF